MKILYRFLGFLTLCLGLLIPLIIFGNSEISHMAVAVLVFGVLIFIAPLAFLGVLLMGSFLCSFGMILMIRGSNKNLKIKESKNKYLNKWISCFNEISSGFEVFK